ncbi:MAG: hypothetical protein ACR2GZ_07845 [Solirubrobacteraceae bacterium]
MSRLIKMDRSGHTVVAEWRPTDPPGVAHAAAALREELEHGYIAVVATGPGLAEQVQALPDGEAQVILRRPIAGG